MKTTDKIQKLIGVFLITGLLLGTQKVCAESILPSAAQIEGVGMPSLSEALQRLPNDETENSDGSVTELYLHVNEKDYNTFGSYLKTQSVELGEYSVEHGVLTAKLQAKDASFIINYDSESGEVKVIYPAGTFNEWLKQLKKNVSSVKAYLKEGNTDEALAELLKIPDYRNFGPVKDLLREDTVFASIVEEHEERQTAFRTIGNIVTFGRYEQDNDTKNGPEEIEWIVLDYDEKENKALLLSRYGLDGKPYGVINPAVWETSSLRKWLNGLFLDEAFTKKEQSPILITKVDNSPAQACPVYKQVGVDLEYLQDGGNDTQDRIFILSYAEAERYLGLDITANTNMATRLTGTPYAFSLKEIKSRFTMGTNVTDEGKKSTLWWLRSPGRSEDAPAMVNQFGALDYLRSDWATLVRPALWLNINADI